MDGKPSPSKGSGSKPRTSSGIAAMKAAKRAAMKSSSPSKSGSGDTVLRDPDQNAIDAKTMIRDKTGLVYDPKMLKHANPWDSEHIENPERLRRVHERCQELELIRRCQPIPSRPARDEEILLCHSQELLDQTKSMMSLPNEEIKAICLQRYHSVYMNQDSLETAQLAAGAAVDLTTAVVKGEVQNGMALVRPPGHHAMKTEYCGFCIFNNVAIAARHALNNLGVKRILIVDFDVHHGQATQHEFYRDPRVLYLSLHRYEHGLFWPHLRESDYDLTGEESGKGYNVNIPLNQVGMEDQDYLAVFHQILLPMAYEFQPELVLVSAGYDGALGCPEGEMRLSPMGYDHMIRSLMALAGGKIAVVLEGGYFIESLAEGAALSLRALIGDAALPLPALPMPNDSIMETILNSLSALRAFWKNLRIQEDYNISEYDAATDENCHEPTVIYKGQKSCEIRDLELASYDQGEHYLKHSEETKIKFLSELDDMRRRYLHLLQANPKDKISVVYDESMKRHRNMEDPGHPERPDRISSIYKYLHDYGLLDRDCIERLSCRRATAEEIGLCHDERYYGKMSSLPETQKELSAISDGFDSVYLNPSSFDCALLSAGSLLNVLQSVCEGNSARGCAVIRPPGHHAEEDEACGFCIFNNVPIAAKVALEQHGMERILILDWDVHHGNGIQNMFYDDPRVLYISIHRYDAGTFFPNKKDANFDFVGSGKGEGYNINIPWNGSGMGDPEYVLAMFNIVLPVAYQFNPDLVLVSAGFDAARGDPLGGCKVSPEMYGHMTHHLMNLARGRVIVALEGGYNLNSIALSMTMCAKALAGDPLPSIMPERDPKLSAIQSIRDVIGVHSKFWSCLRFGVKLPDSFEDLREGIKTPRKMKPGLGGDAVAEKQDTIQEAGNKASAISPSQAVSRSSDYIPNQYGTQAVSNSAYIPNEFGACFSASYVTSQSTSSNSYKRSLPSEERVTDSKVHSQAEMNRQAEEAFKMMQKVELVSPNRRSHTDYIPQQFGSQSFGSVTVQTFSNSTSGPKCQVTDTKKKEAPN